MNTTTTKETKVPNTNWTPPEINHARIVKTAAGRTWCGSPGRRVVTENRTLCGAAPGRYDYRLRGNGTLSKGEASTLLCTSCRNALGLSGIIK